MNQPIQLSQEDRDYINNTRRIIRQLMENTIDLYLEVEQRIDFAAAHIKRQLIHEYQVRCRAVNQAVATLSASRAGYKPIMDAFEAQRTFQK